MVLRKPIRRGCSSWVDLLGSASGKCCTSVSGTHCPPTGETAQLLITMEQPPPPPKVKDLGLSGCSRHVMVNANATLVHHWRSSDTKVMDLSPPKDTNALKCAAGSHCCHAAAPGGGRKYRTIFIGCLQITPLPFPRGQDSLAVLYSYQEVAIGNSVLASAS